MRIQELKNMGYIPANKANGTIVDVILSEECFESRGKNNWCAGRCDRCPKCMVKTE